MISRPHYSAPGDRSCDETFDKTPPHSGISYVGCQTKTHTGKTCQKWNVDKPHIPNDPIRVWAKNVGTGTGRYCLP